MPYLDGIVFVGIEGSWLAELFKSKAICFVGGLIAGMRSLILLLNRFMVSILRVRAYICIYSRVPFSCHTSDAVLIGSGL